MTAALERAAEDAGNRALLERADSIRAPRGIWDYSDPCRLIAERIGAARAKTEIAEIGVLQTTLLGRAAADIAAGRADVVLLSGGEAKDRARRAKLAGLEAPLTQQQGVTPNSVLRPEGDIVSEQELRCGLAMPVTQYAMIENALRAAEGKTLQEHRQEVAELWARMSQVAADNPHAWNRKPVSVNDIRDASPSNRMLAFPYTKLHTSQWNVDQAAGLILCSLETARALGVREDRMVFPLAVADANHMVPVSERRRVHRLPGYAHAAKAVLASAGKTIDDVKHLEIYSCFPIAVRLQAREIGIDLQRQLTVTGGMAFAGGPLNNFVFQGIARMVEVLRADPQSVGMVTAVSGMLTKQGVSLWSTRPGAQPFSFDDVTEATARDTQRVALAIGAEGPAAVATYTVLFDGDTPVSTVLLCDLPDKRRALVRCEDAALAELGTREELCGRRLRLSGDGRVELS